MRLILLLISFVGLYSFSAIASDCFFPQADGQRCEYTTEMRFKDNSVSGVSVMKLSGDTLMGSMINEFGIKAFDFIVYKGKKKVKLLNVVSFLDKWYIKRTIRGDLKYLFTYHASDKPDKNRSLAINGDSLELINKKRDITYRFFKIKYQSDEINR